MTGLKGLYFTYETWDDDDSRRLKYTGKVLDVEDTLLLLEFHNAVDLQLTGRLVSTGCKVTDVKLMLGIDCGWTFYEELEQVTDEVNRMLTRDRDKE